MTSLPNAKPPGLGPGKSDSYTLPLSTTALVGLPKDAVNPSLEALPKPPDLQRQLPLLKCDGYKINLYDLYGL